MQPGVENHVKVYRYYFSKLDFTGGSGLLILLRDLLPLTKYISDCNFVVQFSCYPSLNDLGKSVACRSSVSCQDLQVAVAI